MTNREIDRLAHKHVFGDAPYFSLDTDYHGNPWPVTDDQWPPHYVTNAQDDFSVLVKVRETWTNQQKEKFWDAAGDLLCKEHFGVNWRTHDLPSICFMEYYKPGIWTLAALAALGVDLDKETGE